jgi:hypothetical protein
MRYSKFSGFYRQIRTACSFPYFEINGYFQTGLKGAYLRNPYRRSGQEGVLISIDFEEFYHIIGHVRLALADDLSMIS